MNYPRNAWYAAAWSKDLVAYTPMAVSILNEPVVLWRNPVGKITALADRCVHRLAPLSKGRCEGVNLRCQYHGFLFNPEGAVIEIPGQTVIPPGAKVRSYPVADRHSWIWVWMGDAALADESLIPPAVGLEDPDWIFGHGQLDYDAEARLINDNLLDFSHLPYVHAQSFQTPTDFASQLPQITGLPRGVRFARWIENSPPPLGAPGGPVDGYTTYDFLIPGILLMWSGNYPVGTAAACNRQKPDFSAAISGVNFTCQAVTPTGPKSARYFFSWGPHCRHGDAALRDQMMKLAGQAFSEDKVMIEAQQKVIDRTEHPVILPSAQDRGVTMFNQIVNRMLREEKAAA